MEPLGAGIGCKTLLQLEKTRNRYHSGKMREEGKKTSLICMISASYLMLQLSYTSSHIQDSSPLDRLSKLPPHLLLK